MLTKRIIPCLDYKDGHVVKGRKFLSHRVCGNVEELADRYSKEGADELIFYDITASSDLRCVDTSWIKRVAQCINIPFCVGGGIHTINDAEKVLKAGADKISINTPALSTPSLIDDLVKIFGQQCVVIGVDSFFYESSYYVYKFTGSEKKMCSTGMKTHSWIQEVQDRGAGEIVLNCMNSDGMLQGYDMTHLETIRKITHVPLIASGGAGSALDFYNVFKKTSVDGALASSVFHDDILSISQLKRYLQEHDIEVRR